MEPKGEPSPLAKHMSANNKEATESSPYDNPSMLSEHSNFNSGSDNSSGIADAKFGLGKKKHKPNGFEARNGYHSQAPLEPQPLDPVAEEKGESFRADDEGRPRVHTLSNNSANTKFNYKIPVGELQLQPIASSPPPPSLAPEKGSKMELARRQSNNSPAPASPKTPPAFISHESSGKERQTRDRAQFSFSGPTANTFNNYYATGTLMDDPEWYDPNQYEKRYENGRILYIRLVEPKGVQEQHSEHSEQGSGHSRTNYHVPPKFQADNYYLGATQLGESPATNQDMVKTVPVKGLDNKGLAKRIENGIAVYSLDRRNSRDQEPEGRSERNGSTSSIAQAYMREYKSLVR